MTRRANGEGTLSQRPDGRWIGQMRYEDADTGERKRVSVYGRTKTEARQKLKEAHARIEAGSPVRDSGMTVAAWLKTWREGALASSSRKPSTKSLYSTLCRVHLEPAPFGAVALDRMKPSHVHKLLARLEAEGSSGSTRRQVYHVLRLALSEAVDERLIARNVTETVKRPLPVTTEAKYLKVAEVAALLKAAQSSRYHAVLVLIAATGVRRGEALALKWTDVDLKAATMRIHGTLARVGGALVVTEPKTPKSIRTLALTPSVVNLLRAHKAAQRVERMAAANIWTNTGYVFTTESGQPVDPRNVFRTLQVAAKKAKITGIGLHTLRHSAATAMLEGGVNLKAVSDILGHSSVAITGDVYAHASQEVKRAAMETLSDAIGL